MCLADGHIETISVTERILRCCTIVIAERLLIELTEKMERFDAHIGSVDAALQQAPEVL
jgi:hypothetical protein